MLEEQSLLEVEVTDMAVFVAEVHSPALAPVVADIADSVMVVRSPALGAEVEEQSHVFVVVIEVVVENAADTAGDTYMSGRSCTVAQRSAFAGCSGRRPVGCNTDCGSAKHHDIGFDTEK